MDITIHHYEHWKYYIDVALYNGGGEVMGSEVCGCTHP